MISDFAQAIAAGLKRSAMRRVSDWATTYRVMGEPFPGPWSFEHHPWAREMCDCDSQIMIGQKAAQMAYTEVALNKVFKAIDIDRISVMYALPASTPDAHDFSTSRFDPALEMSPHLKGLFSDVKNITHKRAGTANLFIRGSRSRSQMKSVPVGLMIFDELDEMNQKNVPLAFERMSGQRSEMTQAFLLSTPTIERYGINEWFIDSTQDHYDFPCPHCSRWTELDQTCLVLATEDLTSPLIRESHLICKECKAPLPHESKKEWLAKAKWNSRFPGRTNRGFYINQLYSMVLPPWKIAESLIKSRTNPAAEQEFYNSKMGLPHTVEGARITEANLKDCIREYMKAPGYQPGWFVTMGVDVGKSLHYEIDRWNITSVRSTDVNILAKCALVTEGKVRDFSELDTLMHNFRVRFCVIDANPERRKSEEFCGRFPGRSKMCFYGRGISNKTINIHENSPAISVDRTSWMDVALTRFHKGTILLPQDTSMEYREHLKAPARIYEEDSDGNLVGRYVCGNEADHLAHARTYSEIALYLAASMSNTKDIQGVY